ncbi:leucyl/phenylalanyl-tRNA--protein transferase [Alkalimarinus sediminis]|uniref:Leucyl/phenylalanyl-tRNA--protein transferase n=1 Tax=Alkalimarinus sediminis TaxID=1632866 RepID=A0A9E8HMM1_9ALTE|nr:leucyl/phenylalanyl-tRNA--protein transferase [Alkalimarinus sediminis]UZW76122.1 leucyl/phenylalanyl-tRNA--protein transferase [Alkalimarinus sediminis]
MSQIPWLDESLEFPELSAALTEPDGLLAAGGDLSPERIITAYKQGIFPWFSDDQPILWWSPNPRCVVFPDKLHISKSLKKRLNKQQVTVTFDQDFAAVIQHCADTRRGPEEGTWITEDMLEAYIELHHLGVAHSVEVWNGDKLVGGLYGLAIGRCFFGESMFSLETDASKTAFVYLNNQLKDWNYQIIDCQVENPHLLTLGAETIQRSKFQSILKENIDCPPTPHQWEFSWKWSKPGTADNSL